MERILLQGCGWSQKEASPTQRPPRRRKPEPKLPLRHPASSYRLLLCARHDLGKAVPLLTPGGFEFLSALKLNLITELFDERLKRAVLGHLFESCFQLLSNPLRNPFRSQDRSPLREYDVNAFFAHRRDVGQVTVPPGVGDCERSHLPGPDLGK